MLFDCLIVFRFLRLVEVLEAYEFHKVKNNQTIKQHVPRSRTRCGGLHVDVWSVAQRIFADAMRAFFLSDATLA